MRSDVSDETQFLVDELGRERQAFRERTPRLLINDQRPTRQRALRAAAKYVKRFLRIRRRESELSGRSGSSGRSRSSSGRIARIRRSTPFRVHEKIAKLEMLDRANREMDAAREGTVLSNSLLVPLDGSRECGQTEGEFAPVLALQRPVGPEPPSLAFFVRSFCACTVDVAAASRRCAVPCNRVHP